MNREIKFRLWNKEDKKYVSPSHIAINGNGVLLITYSGMYLDFENEHYSHLSQKYVVQQYTGLKDKNGVDIYEGDIVKIQGYRGAVHHVQVKWESVDASDDMGADMIGFPRYSEYGQPEVVGNLFENPELLKQ